MITVINTAAANAFEEAHSRDKAGEELIKIPRVAMDYFFISKRDEEAKVNPVIAMVDEETGERYARAAGNKGIGNNGELDWLIMDMADELKSWGHRWRRRTHHLEVGRRTCDQGAP